MNRKSPLMIAAALLVGMGLTTAMPSPEVSGAELATAPSAVQPATPTLGDEFFRVEWKVSPGSQGNARMTGYVYNEYGEAAEHVQLRINELDASGRVVASVYRPVYGTVPGEDRSYFDVQVPASPSYRVTVEGFDFIESGD